jgi:hypothetical protein
LRLPPRRRAPEARFKKAAQIDANNAALSHIIGIAVHHHAAVAANAGSSTTSTKHQAAAKTPSSDAPPQRGRVHRRIP